MTPKSDNNGKPLAFNESHVLRTLSRWTDKRNNLSGVEASENSQGELQEMPEEWYNEQCGQCRYFVPLLDLKVGGFDLGTDWGLCTNEKSSFDKGVMFEHDGCEAYLGADSWVSNYFPKRS